jgi:hypothetical protein
MIEHAKNYLKTLQTGDRVDKGRSVFRYRPGNVEK